MSRYIVIKDKFRAGRLVWVCEEIIPARTSQRGPSNIRREIAWKSNILQGKRASLDEYGIRCLPAILYFVDGEVSIGIIETTSKDALLSQLGPLAAAA